LEIISQVSFFCHCLTIDLYFKMQFILSEIIMRLLNNRFFISEIFNDCLFAKYMKHNRCYNHVK
jgi:hypothetical protein